MLERLLQVGIAAPIVATLGGSSEGAISSQYGGAGGITAAADPVYQAIGQVCKTIFKKSYDSSPMY